jgi:hypothetical protein
VWIHSYNYNQRVPKPLVLVKAIGKCKTNTWRGDVLNRLINAIKLLEVPLVVRAIDMVTPHLGKRENCLLVSKKKKILGIRLRRTCLKQNFSKELRPALAFLVVSRVIFLRHVLSQNLPDY